MLNRCEFIGNLGADPDCRRLSSGDPVVNLSVAVSEKWKGKDGEIKEKTEWVKCVIFNENFAKIAEQYLKKGSKIFIAGKLASRSWEDQSGVKKYATEIVLQRYRGELQMLDSRGEGQQQQSTKELRGGDYGGQSGGFGGGQSPATNQSDLDDEIPF